RAGPRPARGVRHERRRQRGGLRLPLRVRPRQGRLLRPVRRRARRRRGAHPGAGVERRQRQLTTGALRVDLVWLADRPGGPPPWALGEVHVAGPAPADLARVLARVEGADAVACWAASSGPPPEATVEAVLGQP